MLSCDSSKDTKTTKILGNLLPSNPVSNLSNFIEQPTSFATLMLLKLVHLASFLATLEKLGSQSKTMTKICSSISKKHEKIGLVESWKFSISAITVVDKSLKVKMYVFKKTVMTAVFLLNLSDCKKLNWLICKNFWNATVTCCLSLVVTVQTKTSIWSSLLCYLYLSAEGTLNHWLIKQLIKTSFSSLMSFNYWISCTFSVEQQVLIHSCKHTKP